MRQLRGAIEITERKNTLDRRLLRLIEPGFILSNGALLLKSQAKLAKVKRGAFPDRTGFECFVNHTHIEDQLQGSRPTQEHLLEQGLGFASTLFGRLSSSFPDTPVSVILSHSDSGCVVRFHIIREGEKWLADDLEGYGGEAIFVVSTDQKR